MNIINTLKSRGRLAAAPLVGAPTVAYTGVSVQDAVRDARLQTEALCAYLEAVRPDVVFPFMDLSVEAEALGLGIRFRPDDAPDVVDHPVRAIEDLAKLQTDGLLERGRVAVYLDVIGRLARRGVELVGGYVASPFTLAGLLMSAEELSVATMLDPELASAVVEYACGVTIAYAREQERAGADFIVLLDPTAALLSPTLYEQFAGPWVRRVAESLRVPVVLHVCGQTTPLIPSFVKDPVAGLSLDSDVDLPTVAPLIPADVAIIGNVHPVNVMRNGSPGDVRDAVNGLVESMARWPNFVASTGCDVPPATPIENLEAFVAAVRSDRNAPVESIHER